MEQKQSEHEQIDVFFFLTGESVLWRHADIDACTSSESCGKTTSFAGMKKSTGSDTSW